MNKGFHCIEQLYDDLPGISVNRIFLILLESDDRCAVFLTGQIRPHDRLITPGILSTDSIDRDGEQTLCDSVTSRSLIHPRSSQLQQIQGIGPEALHTRLYQPDHLIVP